jgi:hypothetical protein
MGSRWRSQAGQSVLNKGFSTLGGAAAWCRQHGEARNNVTNFDDEDAEEVEKKLTGVGTAFARRCVQINGCSLSNSSEVALDRLRVREPVMPTTRQ